MSPTVYLDATIPSFYFEERPGTILRAWREITVAFWDFAPGRYELYVSDETVRELEEPGCPAEKRERCLALIQKLPRLSLAPGVACCRRSS
jgi:hypothetical protein